MQSGRNAAAHASASGPVRADMPWNEDSDDRPLRMHALVTFKFYVVLTKKPNGKKYQKFSIKAWPQKILFIDNATGGSGAPQAIDATIPCTVDDAVNTPVIISQLNTSQSHPELSFGDVTDVTGRPFTVNLSSADPAKHASTMLQAVSWPEYNTKHGPATVIEIGTLDGASNAGATLRHVDACVLQYVSTHPELFDLKTDVSPEEVADLYNPMVRGRGDTVRVQLDGARKPRLMFVNEEEDGFSPCDDPDVLYVQEGQSPGKCRVGAMGTRFSVTFRKDEDGNLESFGTKLSLNVVVVERPAEAPVFGGLTVGAVSSNVGDEPPLKKARAD